MCRRYMLLVLVASNLTLLPLVPAAAQQAVPVEGAALNPAPGGIARPLESIPLAFTKNLGQWPDSILFQASAGGTTMWFTRDGIYYQFAQRAPQPHSSSATNGGNPDRSDRFSHEEDSLATATVKARFVGASPEVRVTGLEEQASKSNYFIGGDPSLWRTNVPSYAAVVYQDIYPGVDATFRSQGGQLTYEVHGPVDMITGLRMIYTGGIVTSASDSSVSVQTPAGEKRFRGPLPISEGAAVPVSASSPSAGTLSLAFGTFLGGSGDDYGYGVAVDQQGNVYVTGRTPSNNFPTHTPYQTYQGLSGYYDVFVTKLSSSGNSAIYSTYLGGQGHDHGYAIAIDDDGNAYVTGKTYSTDFPTRSAYQPVKAADYDVFVAKLSPAGDTLAYSTYLGGGGDDEGFGLAIDNHRNAYVTGHTYSSNYPTKSQYQVDPGDGNWDGFVTKLSTAGDSLIYSTYLAGSSNDDAYAIAVTDSGYACVTGSTNSSNFPTKTPYQSYQAARDVFVTKLATAGDSLVYSTFLGGNNYEYGYGIAVDTAGCAYVTGGTLSSNFPTQSPYQTFQGGGAFVTKLAPAGTSLVYSTYLGGGSDEAYAIAVDASLNAYVTGYTNSSNFPTQSPYQTDMLFGDGFVTKLSSTGTSLVYSTYLGGREHDFPEAIAVDGQGNAFVAGFTSSDNFPTKTPYQTYQGPAGHYDAFVTKLSFAPSCCTGTTGNVNMTGIIDVSDLMLLVARLVEVPPPSLPCVAEANVNNVGIIDVSDLSMLVDYLTIVPPRILPNCP